MLFWVLCAVLTAAVLYFVTRPLTVPVAGPSALERDRASDLAVYRDQLSEVEADRARGLLSDAEAEAARIEISRRLLARAESGEPAQGGSGERGLTGARMAFITAVILVPAVSLALYLAYGSPGLPGRPHAERVAASADKATIETLVAKVEERLRAHPEDGQGWDVIAPVYFRQGRFDEAVQAYRNAIRLLGESPKRLAGLGEAQVFAKNGIVTEDARRAFQRLAELEPSRPEPRFWLALAKEQDGDIGGALADYRKLVADAPADADWRAPVEQRIAMLTQRRAGDPRDEAERGPTEQDIAAAGKLAPGERAAMIEQMVEGLAQRLETESQDLAGWQRLMRAYAVLGQKDKANDALAKARKAFAGDETSLAALNDLARKLGLDS